VPFRVTAMGKHAHMPLSGRSVASDHAADSARPWSRGEMTGMDRDADQIVAEIAQRVDLGLQLDDVPGRVDPSDTVPAASRSQGRVYTRGTPDFEAALAQGLLTPLARPPLAVHSTVERAESLVGAALPDLLRRLYLEVANGASARLTVCLAWTTGSATI
jgi:hypothetical protein